MTKKKSKENFIPFFLKINSYLHSSIFLSTYPPHYSPILLFLYLMIPSKPFIYMHHLSSTKVIDKHQSLSSLSSNKPSLSPSSLYLFCMLSPLRVMHELLSSMTNIIGTLNNLHCHYMFREPVARRNSNFHSCQPK